MKPSIQFQKQVYDLVHNEDFKKPIPTNLEPKGDIKFITKIKTDANGTKSFL